MAANALSAASKANMVEVHQTRYLRAVQPRTCKPKRQKTRTQQSSIKSLTEERALNARALRRSQYPRDDTIAHTLSILEDCDLAARSIGRGCVKSGSEGRRVVHAALVGDVYAGAGGEGHGGEVADCASGDAADCTGRCKIGNDCCCGGSAGGDGGCGGRRGEEEGGEDLIMLVAERRCYHDEGLTFMVMDASIVLNTEEFQCVFGVGEESCCLTDSKVDFTPSYVSPLLSSCPQSELSSNLQH